MGRLAGGTAEAGTNGSTRRLVPSGPAAPSTTAPSTAPAPATTAPAPATTPPAPPTTAARPAGTAVGPASAVPVGGAASFTDPASGDPALVVQPQAGIFLAFDAVCPHAGCVVEWDQAGKLFVCPCHGSEFNGRTGDVEIGPATRGLTAIQITKGADGSLYAD